MQKEKKEKHFIHRPVYKGGLKALRAFIAQHKKYPEEALKNKVEGTVVLKYTINNKGNVIDAKVIKSLSPECDQEAIRVVKLLKFHVPRNRAGRVKFHKRIQIHFRLPKAKPEAGPTQLVYTVTSSNKKKEESKEKNRGGGYSIQF